MAKTYSVAVVGATGMVGRKMIDLLLEREFPFSSMKLLASSRSANTKIEAGGKTYTVEELKAQSFEGVDFAFFSAGGAISEKFGPEAARRGAVVIDNSNAFRMDEGVPLVVPEVNPDAAHTHKGIIANPNCSTIQMVVVLEALQRAVPLKRVVAATYQAVSGAGREAVEELKKQSVDHLNGKPVTIEYIPHQGALKGYQLAFNCVPQIDLFGEDDYCKEELKMIRETRKIMGLPELPLTATTVRVPALNCHSIALNVEFSEQLGPDDARKLLANTPGVLVVDDPGQLQYPTALDADGKDAVYVGRIRIDRSVRYGLNLWVVSDNIRKGAATNSIQIAELLI